VSECLPARQELSTEGTTGQLWGGGDITKAHSSGLLDTFLFIYYFFLFVCLFVFYTQFLIRQAGLELNTKPRVILNF
jgi:hypothetical protein